MRNLLVSSLLLAAGCAPEWPPDCPNLKTAKSVAISYSVAVGHPGPNRRLVVPKPAKLLSLLDVKSTLKGASMALAPCGLLQFDLPDGSQALCVIAGPDDLGLHNWGHFFLKTSRFYDEVNALVSAHERRPIGVTSAGRSTS